MSDCRCDPESIDPAQARVLWIALALNAAMALIGGLASWLAHSSGLLADALDMLCDAAAYAISLAAIGRSARFKANAASVSGAALLALGIGVLVDAAHRAVAGSAPQTGWMLAVSLLSLAVNVTVLRMLRPLRAGEVHLRASWIFTRADVVASIGVLLAATLVGWTGSRYPDLVVGAAIGAYVIREAFEIFSEARSARLRSP